MNSFDIRLFDVSEDDRELWNGMLLVDGAPMLNYKEYSLDWHQLVCSLIEPGEYTLLTCTCGDADCAGIGQKNIVSHLPAKLHWEMKQPVPQSFVEFDRNEAIEKTCEILKEIRVFVPRADYGTDFPVLPVCFRDYSLDWCLRTLQSGKIEESPWEKTITDPALRNTKREFYYLLREPDRILPSSKWIRKE